MGKRARSSITGRFITLEEAKRNPKTTEIERSSKSNSEKKKGKKR